MEIAIKMLFLAIPMFYRLKYEVGEVTECGVWNFDPRPKKLLRGDYGTINDTVLISTENRVWKVSKVLKVNENCFKRNLNYLFISFRVYFIDFKSFSHHLEWLKKLRKIAVSWKKCACHQRLVLLYYIIFFWKIIIYRLKHH